MKVTVLFTVLLVAQSVFAGPAFPKNPDAELTPGELCTEPTAYRYPERIPYCDRNVKVDIKRAVIRTYDQDLGYRIRSMPRNKFKIDHYIPLCMGGSNDPENLWPQHESVYQITDELEELLCEKMAEGVLTQARAIDMIKRAKNHLNEVPNLINEANSL